MLNAALKRQWSRLQALAERRLPALTRLRQPESLPIVLHRRRLYTLPTRFGFFFCLLLFFMALGALNFNNNPALILVFLLASIAHTALLFGYFDMRGLRIDGVRHQPVFAGQAMPVTLRVSSQQEKSRKGLQLTADNAHASLDVDAEGRGETTLHLPTEQRGWRPVGRIKIQQQRPLGMFTVWSWIHPKHACLVYPKPEAQPPPLPSHQQEGDTTPQRGQGMDVHGLRPFRMGDARRNIAWKRSAQAGEPIVRELEQPQGLDVMLRWVDVAHLPHEHAISRLTAWVIAAEQAHAHYGLALPNAHIEHGHGAAHRHHCLKTLAELP